MAIELTVPFEMRQRHEPALLRRRPPPVQGMLWRDPSRLKVLGIALACLAALVCGAVWFALPFEVIISAEAGAVGMFLFLMLVMRPFWQSWYEREAGAAPINQSPFKIRLDEEGTHADNAVLRQTMRWPGILGVTQSATATGIWFSRATLLVVPDEALPNGIDRAQMIRAIDGWRGLA